MIKLPKDKEVVVDIAKVIGKLFFLIILFLLLGSVFTKEVNATCYCVNPGPDQCKCSASPPAGVDLFDGNLNGVAVKCTSQAEANSTFELQNAVCGGASETVPWCAPVNGNPYFIFCYGRSFIPSSAVDPKLQSIADNSSKVVSGSFTFNTGTFGTDGPTHEVYVCNAGNFCCGQPPGTCSETGLPNKGSACEPQDGPGNPNVCTNLAPPGEEEVVIQTPDKFDPLRYPCDRTTDIDPLGLGSIWDKLDFHPLRPYPGSPCDPLIPQSKPENEPITFACGKSLTAKAMEQFDPFGPVGPNCTWDGGEVVCTRNEDFDITVDLSTAEIPILGNTQILSLTDAQKVNNYLTWYLMGSVQNWLEDKLFPLVPDDMERLTSFSGPLRKLLPWSSQQYDLRGRMLWGKDSEGDLSLEKHYHDYLVGCQGNVITYWGRVWDRFVKLNPNASDDIITLIRKLIDTFRNSTPVACQFFDTKFRLKDINPPPDPNDPHIKDFPAFWNAYIEWAKEATVKIPILGPLGIDIPIFLPWANINAQIYQNIPFSTLEDVASEVTVSVFDDPRENKQDPDVITQDEDKKSFAGTSGAKEAAIRLGLAYDACPENGTGNGCTPGDTAYYKDQPHLVDLNIEDGSDSKVYIPHLQSSRALTELLQSLSVPKPDGSDFSLMNGEIKDHQGNQDDIPVIKKGPPCRTWLERLGAWLPFGCSIDNSSVRPPSLLQRIGNFLFGGENPAAPEALFGHTPDLPGLEYDARCDLTDVRYNPGDTIKGKSITANLRYTQIYRYEPVQGKRGGAACSSGSECGSGTCEDFPDGSKRCTAVPPIELPTKGYAAIFTKTPFAEEIYQKLIAGKQSVLKRFLFKLEPYGIELKDIPGVSSVAYSAINNNGGSAEAIAGYGGRGAEIYWPRLGSIYDYILGGSIADHNLQKLLRPKELSGGIPPPGLPPGATPTPPPGGQCTTLGYNLPFRDTSINPKSPDALISALRSQNPGGFSQSVLNQAEINIRARYQEVVDRARIAGYNPAFVLTIWIEESAAGALGTSQFGCTAAASDFNSQLNCFLGLYNFYSTNSLFSCRQGGSSATFEDFMLFYSEGICDTVVAQNRQFCANKNFPTRVQNFYGLTVGP